MDNPLPVYTTRPWTDHTEGAVWTVNIKWYTIINLIIGVSLGIVQPFVERILAHLFAWTCYSLEKSKRKLDHIGRPQASDENAPLLNGSSRASRSGRFALNFRAKICSRTTVTKISSVLLLIFVVSYIIAGTFVPAIPINKAALSASKICGYWGLRGDPKKEAQDADSLIQGQKETRAGQYARDCYGPQSTTSLNQCLVFTEPYVATSKIETSQRCPFVNETYCSGTGFTAVKFTTGVVEATRIGVNADRAPYFNRTMVCVPLDLNSGFVTKSSREPGWWSYDLGPVDSEEYSSEYTFEQYGDPFKYDVRSYTLSTYWHVYSKTSSQNYWQPIPALNIRPELNTQSTAYSLTLMFINSCRIFYEEDSNDPIFPADRPWPRDPELWVNNDSRARPLACIDWIEVCTRDGTCSPPYQDDQGEDKFYNFTRLALNKSTAYSAIKSRGAMGLDAQYKIQGDISLPLSKNPPQWITESWGLFNTSLARIQYDALDIANGTGWDNPLYVQMEVPSRDSLCEIFTFYIPKGYYNIKLWSTIFIMFGVPLFIFLAGMQTDEDFSEEKKRSTWFDGDKLIGFEWVCWHGLKFIKRCSWFRDSPRASPDQSPQNASAQGGENRSSTDTVHTDNNSTPATQDP